MTSTHKTDLNSEAKRRALFEELLEQEAPTGEPATTIPRRAEKSRIPLSFAQEQLWYFFQLDPSNCAYNIPTVLRLGGTLDIGALQRSLEELVRRHEALRTRVDAADGSPAQVIEPINSIDLPVIDLSALPDGERIAEAWRLCREEAHRPFDLRHDLMLRAKLFRLEPKQHHLFLNVHHIAADGWSMRVLLQELAVLYDSFSQGRNSPLSDLPIQFADFAIWQRQFLQGKALASQLAYWKDQLRGAPSVQELPTDFPRPARNSFRGTTETVVFPLPLFKALETLAQREGVSLYVLLLAGFQTLLFRHAGQDDIVVGSPVAGRGRIETEGLVGMFANMVSLRGNLSGNPTFRELLQQLQEVTFGALAHQDLPFSRLVDELGPERSLSHQVVFSLQEAISAPKRFGGLTVNSEWIPTQTAKFDLSVLMNKGADGLIADVEYCTDLFERKTILSLLEHYKILLEGIVANPDTPIGELSLLTDTELHKVLVEWNQTETSYPRSSTVHELFELQASRTPHAVAVVFENRRLTYRELNEKANQLAHFLIGHAVGPDVRVAVCTRRSIEMVIAMLGVLKAGGGFVPLNPSDPADRLGFVLDDTGATLILTQQQLYPGIEVIASGRKVMCLDTGWEAIAKASIANLGGRATGPQNLAYVMYTSGSTGRPKGVMVEHRSVVRLVKDTNYCAFGPTEVFLQLAPISFDASTFEIWGALLNGGRLVVMPPEPPSLEDLGRVIRDQGVTTLWLTAGLFHVMVEQRLEDLKPLRQLLAGGDVLSPWHVRQVVEKLPALRLINGYGPTENTTFTCCHAFASGQSVPDPVPIGRPISNTRVYVLDSALQAVPIGKAGELFIAGDGLARGYLNSPDLTATKFVTYARPDGVTERVYRTGDQARFLPDGAIQFLGRSDNQIKLRGYRIELDEIEAVLRRHPGIRQAYVVAERDGISVKRLLAYCVPAEKVSLSETALHEHLRSALPQYMLPEAIIILDALPLTANGKVDRDKLPSPGRARDRQAHETSFFRQIFSRSETTDQQKAALVAPRNEYETLLAEIWQDVFKLPAIGIHDDFFALGGNSLLAAKFISKLEKESGITIDLSTIIVEPTIARLANKIRLAHEVDANSLIIPLRHKGAKRPLFCIHPGGGHLFHYLDLVKALPEDQPVYGLRPPDVDTLRQVLSVDRLATMYIGEIQKVQSQGPYQLCGMSFGGLVAYEMARQLANNGSAVAVVALFDTANPANYPKATIANLGNSWISYFVSLYHKYVGGLLRGNFNEVFSNFWASVRTRARLLLWRAVRFGCVLIGRPVPKSMHNMLDTFVALNNSYVPRMFSGHLVLFRAQERQAKLDDDATLGWGDVVQGGVKVHDVPGGHISMMRPPNVLCLANQLKQYLADVPIFDE